MEKYSSTSPEDEGLTGMLSGLLAEADVDDELLSPELQELVEGVMQELYKEISQPPPPPPPPVVFVGDVKGAEGESCGPFVSDSASTVMAGVEFAGKPAGDAGCWVVVGAEEEQVYGGGGGGGKSNELEELGFLMDGCDSLRFWG